MSGFRSLPLKIFTTNFIILKAAVLQRGIYEVRITLPFDIEDGKLNIYTLFNNLTLLVVKSLSQYNTIENIYTKLMIT